MSIRHWPHRQLFRIQQKESADHPRYGSTEGTQERTLPLMLHIGRLSGYQRRVAPEWPSIRAECVFNFIALCYSVKRQERTPLTLRPFHLPDFESAAWRVCWRDLTSNSLDSRFTTGSTIHLSADGIRRLKPMSSCSIYTPLSLCSYLETL